MGGTGRRKKSGREGDRKRDEKDGQQGKKIGGGGGER